MAKFFTTNQLKELFSEDTVGVKLESEFFDQLTTIALDFTSIYAFFNEKRDCIISITDEILDSIKSDFSRKVVYDTLSFLVAIKRSKEKFSSVFTILIEPNSNFHPSNAFHPTLSAILHLVASTSTNIFKGQPFISKRPCLFTHDKIHLSELGSKKLSSVVRDCVRIIAKNFSADSSNMNDVVQELGTFCRSVEPKHSCTDLNCSFARRPKLDGKFDNIHYWPKQASGKILAVWSSKSILNDNGKYKLLKLNRDHLVVIHGTSMFRGFIENNAENIKYRAKRSLLALPATITISPGGMASHIAVDIKESSKLSDVKISAFISIFHFGSNEKLFYSDIVCSHLCDNNQIRNAKRNCSICSRKKTSKSANKCSNSQTPTWALPYMGFRETKHTHKQGSFVNFPKL